MHSKTDMTSHPSLRPLPSPVEAEAVAASVVARASVVVRREQQAKECLRLGQQLHTDGDSEGAVALFQRAFELAPQYERVPDLQYNLGVLLYSVDRYSDALKYFDEAIKLRQDYVAAHLNRGHVLGALQRSHEAVDAFRTVISIESPDSPLPMASKTTQSVYDAHKAMMPILYQQKEYILAFSSVDWILSIATRKPKGVELGELLETLKMKVKLLTILGRRTDAVSTIDYLARNAHKAELDAHEYAEIVREHVESLAPNTSDPHEKLSLWQLVCKLVPSSENYCSLGLAQLSANNDWVAARQAFRVASRLAPTHWRPVFLIAKQGAQHGDPDEAIVASLETSLALAQATPTKAFAMRYSVASELDIQEIECELGKALSRTGSTADANKHLQLAMTGHVSKSSTDACLALVQFELRAGRVGMAQRALDSLKASVVDMNAAGIPLSADAARGVQAVSRAIEGHRQATGERAGRKEASGDEAPPSGTCRSRRHRRSRSTMESSQAPAPVTPPPPTDRAAHAATDTKLGRPAATLLVLPGMEGRSRAHSAPGRPSVHQEESAEEGHQLNEVRPCGVSRATEELVNQLFLKPAEGREMTAKTVGAQLTAQRVKQVLREAQVVQLEDLFALSWEQIVGLPDMKRHWGRRLANQVRRLRLAQEHQSARISADVTLALCGKKTSSATAAEAARTVASRDMALALVREFPRSSLRKSQLPVSGSRPSAWHRVPKASSSRVSREGGATEEILVVPGSMRESAHPDVEERVREPESPDTERNVPEDPVERPLIATEAPVALTRQDALKTDNGGEPGKKKRPPFLRMLQESERATGTQRISSTRSLPVGQLGHFSNPEGTRDLFVKALGTRRAHLEHMFADEEDVGEDFGHDMHPVSPEQVKRKSVSRATEAGELSNVTAAVAVATAARVALGLELKKMETNSQKEIPQQNGSSHSTEDAGAKSDSSMGNESDTSDSEDNASFQDRASSNRRDAEGDHSDSDDSNSDSDSEDSNSDSDAEKSDNDSKSEKPSHNSKSKELDSDSDSESDSSSSDSEMDDKKREKLDELESDSDSQDSESEVDEDATSNRKTKSIESNSDAESDEVEEDLEYIYESNSSGYSSVDSD